MSANLGKGVTGVIMLALCILNIVALSIIVVESKGTNVTQDAIKTAEAGIGITLAATGLYTIYIGYKVKNPGNSSFIANIFLFIIFGILCILNCIAMAVVLIETDVNNHDIQVDSVAVQMAYAGIIITMLVTFIYMVYCFATIKSKSSVQPFGSLKNNNKQNLVVN